MPASWPTSPAACVIVAPALREQVAQRRSAIVTDDPYLYFARLTQWWASRSRPAPDAGVHPSAVIEAGARIDASASVGATGVRGRGRARSAVTPWSPRNAMSLPMPWWVTTRG